MLQQKRNLSAFRQYQENVSHTFDEESVISDFSDDENLENNACNNINTSESIRYIINGTSKNSFYYTPPAKRIKRVPLSAVRLKTLKIERPRRRSYNGTSSLYNDINSSLRSINSYNITEKCFDFKDGDDEQELTIEWSSSEDSDNNTTKLTSTRASERHESEEKPLPTLSQCTQQSSTNKTAVKTNLFKRCRRGGYLHQFQQAMKHLNVDRKFLEHDKNFGLRQYTSLSVLKVEESFGVYLATVVAPNGESSQIVLNSGMAQNVTIGSILESFVEHVEPYKTGSCDGMRKIFIQPGKFLLS